MTTTVYECIYCDFWTEDEQDYNRHMLEHQEQHEMDEHDPDYGEPEDIDSWKLGYSSSTPTWGPHDTCQGSADDQPRIPFMWDGRIVR